CRPADPRLPVHFRVELPRDAPRPGSLLLLEPLEPVTSDMWSARLVSEYGREDDVSVQEELVKANHEVPRDFSLAALQEASKLPQEPLAEDLLHRKDLRSMPLVTIDDPDARDLDDAVHVQKLSEGGWLLSVAIADVSHYVRPRSSGHAGSLDREALARGNSWYFPQSVEPMLPPALCHGLCSLNPGEDRLAMLVQVPFSSDGQPGKARFASIVMRSAARLTYDQVKTYLLDKSPDAIADFCKQHAHGNAILSMLSQALDLAEQLHSVRQKRGSLDFDLPEMDYRFDNDGRVAWLGHRIRHNAHRLIEEFMIAANEAVARHLCETGLPFLYRVHPKPEENHLDDLRHSLETVGPVGLSVRPHALQDDDLIHAVLSGVRGTPGEGLVNRLCLRAMPQARYQTNNTGHYGLASQAYCHFTSPIRRYADLLTHRALKTSLGLNCGPLPAGQKLLRIGDTLNHRERAAMDCEREMNKRLSCLALQPRVGESFKGLVSGVMSYGVFVELKNIPVEGMIRVDDLGADHYDYDTNHMCLLGRRSGVVWHLGQEISVVVTAVDLGRLEIRLIPAELPQGLRRGKKDSDTRSRRRTDGPRRHRHSKGSY
ncbi:MAG: VacB/RNase II family 3'-5' exoribonuclease, partial [Desulfovibrio sp.]|nr:VacB/RNase II family 3'-5' exoribonuclease [Desulfovibrio sp.]